MRQFSVRAAFAFPVSEFPGWAAATADNPVATLFAGVESWRRAYGHEARHDPRGMYAGYPE
jgi:hypothetical protein